MRNALLEALADVWISELEGTYLMWIDLGRYIKPEDMKHVIQDKCGLAVDYGSWFGEADMTDLSASILQPARKILNWRRRI